MTDVSQNDSSSAACVDKCRACGGPTDHVPHGEACRQHEWWHEGFTARDAEVAALLLRAVKAEDELRGITEQLEHANRRPMTDTNQPAEEATMQDYTPHPDSTEALRKTTHALFCVAAIEHCDSLAVRPIPQRQLDPTESKMLEALRTYRAALYEPHLLRNEVRWNGAVAPDA